MMGVDSYWKEKQENQCNSRYELPPVSGGCVKRNIKMDSVSIRISALNENTLYHFSTT